MPSSIEETGIVLAALGRSAADGDERQIRKTVVRGAHWLIDAIGDAEETAAAPLGLYFARLWYYEELYPVVFALAGLTGAASVLSTGHEGERPVTTRTTFSQATVSRSSAFQNQRR